MEVENPNFQTRNDKMENDDSALVEEDDDGGEYEEVIECLQTDMNSTRLDSAPVVSADGATANKQPVLVSLKHIKSSQEPFHDKSSAAAAILVGDMDEDADEEDGIDDDSSDDEEMPNKPAVRLRPNAAFLTRYVGGCERLNARVDTTPIPKEELDVTSELFWKCKKLLNCMLCSELSVSEEGRKSVETHGKILWIQHRTYFHCWNSRRIYG